jgi:nucleotide-binding universal stress UspA family protein
MIHVMQPPAGFIEGVFMKESADEAVASLLATLKRGLPKGVPCDDVVATGLPGDQITRAAREWNADLVVVGDHNRHVLSRFLLGSVADAVVRHAPCPVLVARAKDAHSTADLSAKSHGDQAASVS